MDEGIFRKMKTKPGMSARAFGAPEGYPQHTELAWPLTGDADFIHLFVKSSAQFEDAFSQAVKTAKKNALVWVSYPKATGRERYDINRDSLWDLLIPRAGILWRRCRWMINGQRFV